MKIDKQLIIILNTDISNKLGIKSEMSFFEVTVPQVLIIGRLFHVRTSLSFLRRFLSTPKNHHSVLP